MSNSNHAGHAYHTALHVPNHLPPFKEKKDPATAALCGFFFGGIGLGLYFKSWQDFTMPVVLWIICALFAPITIGTSYLAAGCFCAMYGYRRAKASNAKLEAQWREAHLPPVSAAPPVFASQQPAIIDAAAVAPVAMKSPIITPPPAAATNGTVTNGHIEERLRRADGLFQQKLITENEYQAKRQEILSEL